MKEIITMSKSEYANIPLCVAREIVKTLAEGWGYKMVSRETGKEVTDEKALAGFFILGINKGLSAANEDKHEWTDEEIAREAMAGR